MAPLNFSRRQFIKAGMGISLAAAGGRQRLRAAAATAYDARGLSTRVLGRTGVRVPLLGVGTGSRFCAIADEEAALELLSYALDRGLYYWDTAHSYRKGDVFSEERLGKILKRRRREVFVATKVDGFEPDSVSRQLEESLTRLQTDHVDLLQSHSLQTLEDVEALTGRGGLLDLLGRMRDQGMTRYLGFTGHTSARVMAAAARREGFDTMLIALNQFGGFDAPVPPPAERQPFEEEAVPAALEQGLGVMVMKVIRPREHLPGLNSRPLVRYALSLKGVTGAVVGIDSLEVLKTNLDILHHFHPMDEGEKKQMRSALTPFYGHPNLEWMQPAYRDGNWS